MRQMDSPSIQHTPFRAGNKAFSGIPERRSSKHLADAHQISATFIPSTTSQEPPVPPPHATPAQSKVVPSRGRSASPIRRPAVRSHVVPSRTFIPSVFPLDVLDAPRLRHPRVSLNVHLSAPVFVGGATIEGEVHATIDARCSDARRTSLPSLSLDRVSVTVVGIERCKARRDMFRALTTDLVDEDRSSLKREHVLPFQLDLPVFMGPPPYKSKHVGISYLLSVTVKARVAAISHYVRESRVIVVLTVHDRRSMTFMFLKLH